MQGLSRICAIAVLLLTSGGAVSAVEKFTFIRSADAVVVGQLKLSSYFLSFDGLHVNGSIVATEILYGGGALVKGPGSSWTAAEPKLAFTYNLTDREKVIAVLKEREQLEHDRPKP